MALTRARGKIRVLKSVIKKAWKSINRKRIKKKTTKIMGKREWERTKIMEKREWRECM